jgi:hypothetical protein
MKPKITSKQIFDFRAFHHGKRVARSEPDDPVLSTRPLCSAGRRNGVGAAWLYCAASISRFFRSAANLSGTVPSFYFAARLKLAQPT